MSLSTSAPACRRGLRSRLIVLIASLALGAAGLLALAGPAHADCGPWGVTAVNPTSGPPAGGTAVTITGHDFTCSFIGAQIDYVEFGGTPATSFSVDSDTQITATAPAHAAGTVDVRVRNGTGPLSPITTADQYTYTNPGPAYTFTGFFAPVDNPPVVNTVNAGRSIPVKFSLDGDQGLDVLASDSPYSQATACGTGTQDPVETTTDSNSGLTYNLATGRYTYVWKTDKAWEGTCRTFHLKLADGTDHTALFQFS
ncbi:PxKF domain-containing protein [Actinomadura litoris]|uniref:PxKF domain-containing protein n=1 Tax=Actinomadura litoris TaxID=2678616 RepID=UPI001C12A962|nr:PxKF domain-containing protein [Actinomadura litoris]